MTRPMFKMFYRERDLTEEQKQIVLLTENLASTLGCQDVYDVNECVATNEQQASIISSIQHTLSDFGAIFDVAYSRGRPRGLFIGDIEGGQLRFGFSVHNPDDDYSREMAHQIANGRFESGKYSFDVNSGNISDFLVRLENSSIPSSFLDFMEFCCERMIENYNVARLM